MGRLGLVVRVRGGFRLGVGLGIIFEWLGLGLGTGCLTNGWSD